MMWREGMLRAGASAVGRRHRIIAAAAPGVAAQQAPGETATVRRWSAKALTTKRVEPCRATGECPVAMKPAQKPLEAVA